MSDGHLNVILDEKKCGSQRWCTGRGLCQLSLPSHELPEDTLFVCE